MKSFLRKSRLVYFLAKRSFWFSNQLFKHYFWRTIPKSYQNNQITLKVTYNTVLFIYFLQLFCQLPNKSGFYFKISDYKKLLIGQPDHQIAVIGELIRVFQIACNDNEAFQNNQPLSWTQIQEPILTKLNNLFSIIHHQFLNHQTDFYQLLRIVYQMNLNLFSDLNFNKLKVTNIVESMDQIKGLTATIIGKHNHYFFTFYLKAIYYP